MALLLERHGHGVELYDARPDPRVGAAESGRSINLALADRGIHALKAAGVFDAVAGGMIPMQGRMVHPLDGAPSLQRYGQRPSEVIYSVSRHELNRALLEVAAARPGIRAHFRHRLEDVDFARGVATLRDLTEERRLELPVAPLLACDGAGSRARRRMAESGLTAAREVPLDHGYKEFTIPARPDGTHALEREALHIWPRGDFMLIALPNVDGTFTATLFLPLKGPVSFEALRDDASAEHFLRSQFPDVVGLMPDRLTEFRSHPVGMLGTVYADRWSAGECLLLGDAAHAIVPFHGQGMNCCFEDCIELDATLARHDEWSAAFAAFQAARKPHTDAIAAMALENYLEMRARVVDPAFRLQQALALELERRHPKRFIPRYSMVMFHHEIGYAVALERGRLQSALLAELTHGAQRIEDVDMARADREVERRLAEL